MTDRQKVAVGLVVALALVGLEVFVLDMAMKRRASEKQADFYVIDEFSALKYGVRK